ncbi:bone morphogenetic protein 8A isoform X1 [Cyprinodon tularosa]|uniref:bone morphogenetic protein 8A isoform X1 n=1 Tax=Cyprinodon tularosa TaxID=77115 RepID=UPI0018E2263D|nr:bone morphogenetic protein 8A isoform X1 [Cyprinodon tularosa]XP_038158810.1 bone morphogenetic protein 8A isoform X1 [Cyprinodon tularosa]XP_038158811.1 bone morphogenetic protein 8A isoform X1 [Cyprinodon tularosa]
MALEMSPTMTRCLQSRSRSTLMLLLLLLTVSLWTQQAEAVVHSSFRRLSGREKKEMQKEILNLLGLPGRPRPHPPLRPPSSAPLFMLDLYHAMSADDEEEMVNGPGLGRYGAATQVNYAALPILSTHTPPFGTVVSEADTVMSFVNLVEQERNLLQVRPYWKEFRFDLTPLPKGETVTAAEFRIYKTLTVGQRANRTLHISVYEIKRENRNREPELVLLDMQSVPAGQEGWLAFDVTSASNHWLLQPRSNLGIRLYVETEDGESAAGLPQLRLLGLFCPYKRLPPPPPPPPPPLDRSLSASWIGLVGRRGPRSKQPFMVTFFRESQIPCRPPRAVRPHQRRKKTKYDLPIPTIHGRGSVSKGQPCKKHELYVSFGDLGWKDWVLAPNGYSAYYCDGECIHPMGACMNATNHAIIQQVVHLIKPDEVPSACCAPKKLSSISVLFYDDKNNVILKKHRNMVVKTCGCL